jgi:dCTP deaminase
MMILSAQTIRLWCINERPMITPFHERTVYRGKTFGLSAAGYDVRVEFEAGRLLYLASGSFILASTMERFRMPRSIMGIVHDKSSWARRGICVQNTVIEPGWEGYLTLELTNHSDNDIVLEAGSPIAQIVFHELDVATDQPYVGKYQDQQRGPQPAIEES